MSGFFAAQILLFRPFVEATPDDPNSGIYKAERRQCLQACSDSVAALYETYLHKSYFRTWYAIH